MVSQVCSMIIFDTHKHFYQQQHKTFISVGFLSRVID